MDKPFYEVRITLADSAEASKSLGFYKTVSAANTEAFVQATYDLGEVYVLSHKFQDEAEE